MAPHEVWSTTQESVIEPGPPVVKGAGQGLNWSTEGDQDKAGMELARSGWTQEDVAGFSSYDGEFSLPLGLALGSPIFPSGCEGKLGVALESLQGLRDLT